MFRNRFFFEPCVVGSIVIHKFSHVVTSLITILVINTTSGPGCAQTRYDSYSASNYIEPVQNAIDKNRNRRTTSEINIISYGHICAGLIILIYSIKEMIALRARITWCIIYINIYANALR